MAETAWGHKVLAMWFPELLDPFHVREVRSHHLRRLLKLPEPGRYQNLTIFAGIARQLGMTLLELGRVLVEVNGAPYTTWRLGTRVDDESVWEDMLAGGYGAIGWNALGSLDDIEPTKLGKEAIRERLQRSYPTKTASALSKHANQIYAFVRGAQERDLIVAMDGAKVLGVRRITGAYEHLPGSSAPHRRRITWESSGEPWTLPETEGLLTTFVQLHKHPLNLIELEARLLGQSGGARPRAGAPRDVASSAPPVSAVAAKPPPPPPPRRSRASLPASRTSFRASARRSSMARQERARRIGRAPPRVRSSRAAGSRSRTPPSTVANGRSSRRGSPSSSSPSTPRMATRTSSRAIGRREPGAFRAPRRRDEAPVRPRRRRWEQEALRPDHRRDKPRRPSAHLRGAADGDRARQARADHYLAAVGRRLRCP
ncbi:MAG: hypothetical protein IPG04_10430 [Polyangiaceae bacterium]|nr:hypothetical protein [Polyangiaceae bacterium]